MRVSFDLSSGEQVSLTLALDRPSQVPIASGPAVGAPEDALRQLLSDQGGYIFRIDGPPGSLPNGEQFRPE